MGIEGFTPQRSLEQFYSGLFAEWESALRKTAREITGTLAERFEFGESLQHLSVAVVQAIETLHGIDKVWNTDAEDVDPEKVCLGAVRHSWFEAGDPLEHARRVGSFATQPCDLLPWVRWFLLVENYHRTDPAFHERRLDRLRYLKSENPEAPCVTHEDVLLWLEHQLLINENEPLSTIAHKCANQLRYRLDATLRPDVALEAFFYLLLRCHQFCLAETMTDEDTKRLQSVLGWRRFLSLTDVMLVVIQRVVEKEPLPDAVSILEGLMADGFRIRHASFKDPYEADVVPPEETARFEEAKLRLLTPIQELHGSLEQDCASVFEFWQQQRAKVLDQLLSEIRELREMIVQPLPRKHAIVQSLRFFTSWSLAGLKDMPYEEGVNALKDRVRTAFPEYLVKALVRQRRGYEVATRKELAHLLERECRLQWESFRKKPGSRTFGEADFHVAVRTEVLAHGPTAAPNGAADPKELQRVLDALGEHVARFKTSSASLDASFCLGTPTTFPPTGTPLEFVELVREIVPWSKACRSAPALQRLAPKKAFSFFERTVARFAEAFYKLVVAQWKKAQGHTLHLSMDQVPALAAVLVPPWAKVTQGLAQKAVQKFQNKATSLYRRLNHPVCLNEEEVGVHLAHFMVQELKADVLQAAEKGTLDAVRSALVGESQRLVLPGQVRQKMVPEKFLLQWAGILNGRSGDEGFTRNLISILPGLDCGACGEARCAGFALGLAQGRRRVNECVHLAVVERERLAQVLKAHLAEASSQDAVGSAYELFKNPSAWRRLGKDHAVRRAVTKVLDVSHQEVRRRVMEKAMSRWRTLESKPGVCKRPDSEAFYQALVETIGYEATEKIRPEERHWLTQNGSVRLEKEWERLKDQTDWLALERRMVSGGPSVQEAHPEIQAERFYASVPYLHLLSAEDRQRLLAHRLERFEEQFFEWWNQDLLAMNHPRYRIDNWEEFSKVVKNAYWHQENFPPPRRVAEELLQEMEQRGDKEIFFRDVLTSWVHDGREFRPEGDATGAGRTIPSAVIDNPAALKAHVESICRDMVRRGDKTGLGLGSLNRNRLREMAWQAFQASKVTLAEEFLPAEGEASEHELIRNLIGEVLERQEQVRRLAVLVEEAVRSNRAEQLPAEALRAWLLEALHGGMEPPKILEKMFGWFHRYPSWKDALLLDVLQKMVVLVRWRLLVEAFSGVVLEGIPDTAIGWYETAFPRWMKEVEMAVRRYADFDRERLLHYLFVLAKREGDLDVITALLREIRETSDIIEAAWLQFTNDRLTEALPVPLAKGLGARYSLLVNRMKDLEPVRRCLRQGVSRGEKPDVAAAVRELQLYMRFHIVQQAAEAMNEEACFEAFWDEGYNLEGLSKDELRHAFTREWEQRNRWRKDRIWIMTMAVARRLASQSHELYEADKAFSKIRQGLLRGEGFEHARDVMQRRGIALGTLKEAMYRELSELLEKERMESFRKRIRQIVHQLDRKRLRIVQAWYEGAIDRYSIFHVLRQYQKRPNPPSDEDFRDFFMEQWFQRIETLRASHREDREDRIREVDEGFQVLLGVSPLALEKEAEREAAEAWSGWLQASQQEMTRRLWTMGDAVSPVRI
ncbi:(Fe-S)-binding protein [Desulfosoma caldarium]|uniref:Putative Fe-S cluster protein n=1 Tax=Desulfosoma caldarium TaxID=610254 RepID=A0A3N1VPU8_9BACT|nr:(Fe-S)-binding protein [Desulfosoma caldarium]ROR03071.1 putative Fe-S cluster protein [Desulfosoma caldarium]